MSYVALVFGRASPARTIIDGIPKGSKPTAIKQIHTAGFALDHGRPRSRDTQALAARGSIASGCDLIDDPRRRGCNA